MRVAFDVSILGRPEPTGVERAATTLIDAVLAGDEDLELRLLSPDRAPFEGAFARAHAWLDDPRVAVGGSPVATGTAGRTWLWRQRVVPRLLADAGAALHHAPVVALPWRTRCPRIATVHEIPWARRDRPGDRRWSHRVQLRLAASRAARLLCVSERTAEDLAKLHPRAEPRAVVVPHGVDPMFVDAPGLRPPRPSATRGAFALAVGRQGHKKRFDRLIEAFSRDELDGLDLVLIGPEGDATGSLRRAAARLEATCGRPRVRFAGPVADDELLRLYDTAAVLVQPSAFEGFGLPLLEAMARGVPVVTTRDGAADEAVGRDAVEFVGGPLVRSESLDPLQLARAIARVVDDPDHARSLVEAGRRHVATRDAAGMARAVIGLWREVAAERGGHER